MPIIGYVDSGSDYQVVTGTIPFDVTRAKYMEIIYKPSSSTIKMSTGKIPTSNNRKVSLSLNASHEDYIAHIIGDVTFNNNVFTLENQRIMRFYDNGTFVVSTNQHILKIEKIIFYLDDEINLSV